MEQVRPVVVLQSARSVAETESYSEKRGLPVSPVVLSGMAGVQTAVREVRVPRPTIPTEPWASFGLTLEA